MKKTLLTLSLIFSFGLTQAQTLLAEGFDVVPVTNWTVLNLSSPIGAASWFQGNATDPDPDLSGPFDAYAGDPDSYIGVNFQSGQGNATLSNWLFTPSVTLQNGDVISFFTRTTDPGTTVYPDRLQLRIGVGAAPTAPTGATGVGGYTTLALEVNPNLTTTGYPSIWTQYSYTVTGMPTATTCKVAFRYFVTSGGTTGANSDYIGIDSFAITRPLSTGDFFSQNFSISPNPVKSIFNLVSTNGATAENVKVIDINGRTVTEMNVSGLESVQVNVSDLSSGVYFVKVQSELGIGISKIIKN